MFLLSFHEIFSNWCISDTLTGSEFKCKILEVVTFLYRSIENQYCKKTKKFMRVDAICTDSLNEIRNKKLETKCTCIICEVQGI